MKVWKPAAADDVADSAACEAHVYVAIAVIVRQGFNLTVVRQVPVPAPAIVN